MQGIEFSATAFFLIIVVNQWQQYRSKIPFFVAFTVSAVFLLLLGRDHFLIPALTACAVALVLLRRPVEAREELTDE
jgi:predicted branched-subunit amino acid permease